MVFRGFRSKAKEDEEKVTVALKAAEDSRIRAELDYAAQVAKLGEVNGLRDKLAAKNVAEAYDSWLTNIIEDV